MAGLFDSPETMRHCLAVVRPALLLAPTTFLSKVSTRLSEHGIQDAVAVRDTATIYDWIVGLLDLQGISNASAATFAAIHGRARWVDIDAALTSRPVCSKLRSFWDFDKCGYRKSGQRCARRDLMSACALPLIPARKGTLNEAAFGLALFIRDMCEGDLVGWIDKRLAQADLSSDHTRRLSMMRNAVSAPLTEVPGTGPKIWNMILAELLLGADPQRERWVSVGASFVAVDSLVHAFLHRTGIHRRLDADHVYGPSCYAPRGCADVIAGLAARIDAREFNDGFPACFPRWIQFAIWWFCAADGWSICNSVKIDDRRPCEQVFCAAFSECDKIAIKPHA